MKKHAHIMLAITVFLLSIPALSHAISRPFGGRVVSTGLTTGGITCAAMYGPFVIQPVTATIPGPLYIRTGINGGPRVGGWILGNYNPLPNMSTCFTPVGTPVPSWSVGTYGVSK